MDIPKYLTIEDAIEKQSLLIKFKNIIYKRGLAEFAQRE